MTYRIPRTADAVLYYRGADHRGTPSPLPAIVQRTNDDDGLSVSLTVFGSNGGTFIADAVAYRDAEPDATLPCWAWPDDEDVA